MKGRVSMDSADEHAVETSEIAVDRISALPTEILHNILALVRIRTVVRMRRLSRRWREVCESMQFICLNYREFDHWKYMKFSRFVNNLLLLRAKVDLHTFQLHWYRPFSLICNDVKMWIGYAVKHNAKVLDVDIIGYDQTFLPHCVFTCPTLQELSLDLGAAPYGRLGFVLPKTINLPSLRKLTLCDVEVSQLSLDRIIARSPGLEDLNLTNCARYFKLIDSKVLKRLILDGFLDGLDGFTVATPRLIHFECLGCPLEDIFWRERPLLENAHIDTCGHTFDGQSDFTGLLLRAKRLKLLNFRGSDVKVMLEKELPACSVFENLETLEIGDWCLTDNFYVVLRFLQLSPRLEKLTLVHRKLSQEEKGAGIDAVPVNGMTFQCPLLETIVLRCPKDDGGIDKMVSAMVANGVSLEKIHITFHEDMTKRALLEVIREREEHEKEIGIFENTLKENPEWIDDTGSSYSGSDSDNNEDDDNDEEVDNEDDDNDEEVDDEDDYNDEEVEDEDDDDDGEEMELEDDSDEKVENEYDDDNELGDEGGVESEDDNDDGNDLEEDGVDNNEHGDDDL